MKSSIGQFYNHDPRHFRFARECPGFPAERRNKDSAAFVVAILCAAVFLVLLACGVNV
jgi:hypothetical protein